jgi:hypothetical protein
LHEFNLTARPVGISVFIDNSEVSGFNEFRVAKVLCFRQSPRIVDCNVPSASTLTTADNNCPWFWKQSKQNHSISEEMQVI